MSVFLITLGCTKEEVLEPVLEISLDGESFDPNERYAQIKTFGGVKYIVILSRKYSFCIYK